MATPKRRKIDSGQGAQQKSAFALMQQLRAGGGQTAGPAAPTQEASPSPLLAPMSPGPAVVPAPNGRRLARMGSSKSNETSSELLTGEVPVSVTDESLDPASGDSQGPAASAAKQFSTFRANKQNSRKLSGGILQLKLVESERFLVLGNFGLRVVSGEVTLAGASLRPGDPVAWICAALCHAVPVLRCSEDARVELLPHPQDYALRCLGKLSPLFRGLWNSLHAETLKGEGTKQNTFQIIYTSDDAPRKAAIRDLVALPAWNKKLAELVTPIDGKTPVVFLCGPKSSGKSTFGRILGNRLLTAPNRRSKRQAPAVAVLDLDPGQPEYSPAGTMALVHVKHPNLSPSFTRPIPDESVASILRLHATASVSPASDPELYVKAAIDLYHHYQQSALRSRPLIINTPGWILGTGLDLLTELISNINPNHVIYMSEDGPAESVDALKTATKGALALLPSQQSDLTTRTAAQLRAMQSMAYFHSLKGEGGELLWNSTPLSSVPPLLVRFSGNDAGILAILSYEFQPPADLLAETINGSVLALVEIEDALAFKDLITGDGNDPQTSSEKNVEVENPPVTTEPRPSWSPEGLPYIPNPDSQTLDPRYSQTLGLVLVRGVDAAASMLQLLTPVPLNRIEQSRGDGRSLVLIHGKFDTPGWAYTEDSYLRSSREEAGDESLQTSEAEGSDEDANWGNTAASRDEPDPAVGDVMDTPWVEVLKGNEKRPVGSRVWRVRRDLGKGGPGGGD